METTLATLISFGKLMVKMKVVLLKARVKSSASSTCCLFLRRAMRRAAFARFGRVTPKISSAAFNYMYKELTGDQSAATNIDQAEIEKKSEDDS